MNKIMLSVFAVVGVFAVIAGLGLFLAFPLKWCWNYVMPYLFELKTITWGQAWCLHFVCGLLLKSTQTNNNN